MGYHTEGNSQNTALSVAYLDINFVIWHLTGYTYLFVRNKITYLYNTIFVLYLWHKIWTVLCYAFAFKKL